MDKSTGIYPFETSTHNHVTGESNTLGNTGSNQRPTDIDTQFNEIRDTLNDSIVGEDGDTARQQIHSAVNECQEVTQDTLQRLGNGHPLQAMERQLAKLDRKLSRLTQLVDQHMGKQEPSRAGQILKSIATVAAVVVVAAVAVGAMTTPFGLVLGAAGLAFLIKTLSQPMEQAQQTEQAAHHFNATPWKSELADLSRSIAELHRKIEAIEQRDAPYTEANRPAPRPLPPAGLGVDGPRFTPPPPHSQHPTRHRVDSQNKEQRNLNSQPSIQTRPHTRSTDNSSRPIYRPDDSQLIRPNARTPQHPAGHGVNSRNNVRRRGALPSLVPTEPGAHPRDNTSNTVSTRHQPQVIRTNETSNRTTATTSFPSRKLGTSSKHNDDDDTSIEMTTFKSNLLETDDDGDDTFDSSHRNVSTRRRGLDVQPMSSRAWPSVDRTSRTDDAQRSQPTFSGATNRLPTKTTTSPTARPQVTNIAQMEVKVTPSNAEDLHKDL
jgi:hypothetical protein